MEGFLISVSVGLLVFLLCRELFCWYFKINESMARQEAIDENLNKLLESSLAILKVLEKDLNNGEINSEISLLDNKNDYDCNDHARS